MLQEILKGYKLILASQSPRRKMLLEGLDVDYEVLVREGVEEDFPEGLDKINIPEFLAQQKSDAYTDLLKPDVIVITADTIVWHKEEVLGKPEDKDHAIEILSRLSGSMHEVVTGVCLRSENKKEVFSSLSRVYFKPLSADEINYYLTRYKPYDKAGAYGIQEWIGYVAIEKIEGSFYNVMGLPVQTLYSKLIEFVS